MEDLKVMVSLPEGKTLEFKRDLSSMKPILKTLIAFANTAGGTLLIGKDNKGSVIGINDVFAAEEKLANAIADSIYPPLMPEIETTSLEGKALIVVRVARWRGPFYLKAQGEEEGVYIRLGSTNRLAGPELIAELKRAISNTSFDQLPCPDVGVDGLDMSRVKQAFSNVGRRVDKKELETLGILVPYAGQLVCSKGGLILFGQDQLREKYFPNATVRCARFQGTEKVDFIAVKDLTPRQEKIINFLHNKEPLSAQKIHHGLKEQISERSLRKDLLELKDRGHLKMLGSGPSTLWELIK